MAEINAKIDDVVQILSAEVARLTQDNAVMQARLRDANARLDAFENPIPPEPRIIEVDSDPVPARARR